MSSSIYCYSNQGKCFCGHDTMVQISWTRTNPGRRFLACPAYDARNNSRGCSYFRWIDNPMTIWQKDVILKLMAEKRDIENELIWQQKANRRLMKHVCITLVFCLIITKVLYWCDWFSCSHLQLITMNMW